MDVVISLWVWVPIIILTIVYTIISSIGDSQDSTPVRFFKILCSIAGFAFLLATIIGFVFQHVTIS